MSRKRTGKRASAFIILLFAVFTGKAQYDTRAISILAKLDSIRNSSSVSRHFADIYFETTSRAIDFFSKADINVQCLMDRFEKRFAGYFFCSVNAYQQESGIPREWKYYYADPDAPVLRYILFGVNAHINGDIWQALISEFSLEELRQFKRSYFLYRKSLMKIYQRVYETAIASDPKIKLFHSLSFGLDKLYGKIMLHRWRNRQMKLAELYYTDHPRFEKKLIIIQRKMDRLNERIRKNI